MGRGGKASGTRGRDVSSAIDSTRWTTTTTTTTTTRAHLYTTRAPRLRRAARRGPRPAVPFPVPFRSPAAAGRGGRKRPLQRHLGPQRVPLLVQHDLPELQPVHQPVRRAHRDRAAVGELHEVRLPGRGRDLQARERQPLRDLQLGVTHGLVEHRPQPVRVFHR
eukprot:31156-Pelagococcus_subviridis.AAC.6